MVNLLFHDFLPLYLSDCQGLEAPKAEDAEAEVAQTSEDDKRADDVAPKNNEVLRGRRGWAALDCQGAVTGVVLVVEEQIEEPHEAEAEAAGHPGLEERHVREEPRQLRLHHDNQRPKRDAVASERKLRQLYERERERERERANESDVTQTPLCAGSLAHATNDGQQRTGISIVKSIRMLIMEDDAPATCARREMKEQRRRKGTERLSSAVTRTWLCVGV